MLDPKTNTRKVGPVRVSFSPEFSVGKGCMGTSVYIGLHDDGSEVAVKRILANEYESSMKSNEVEIANLVDVKTSDHIVNYRSFIHETGDTFCYVILDLCEETLADYVRTHNKQFLERRGPIIIKEILTGLHTLHTGVKKILHRNLKPRNILVDHEGRMRLADFGVSRILDDEETSLYTGQVGNLCWSAAESIERRKDGTVTFKRKSDVQVVGMISFYILTKGKHPFGAVHECTFNIKNGNPVNMKELSDRNAKRFVSWLISHKINDRPYVEQALADDYLQMPPDNPGQICGDNQRKILVFPVSQRTMLDSTRNKLEEKQPSKEATHEPSTSGASVQERTRPSSTIVEEGEPSTSRSLVEERQRSDEITFEGSESSASGPLVQGERPLNTNVPEATDKGKRSVEWRQNSKEHRLKFEELVKILKTKPSRARKIGTYQVCFETKFLIGQGSDGTRVYIGLGEDGIEVAVKKLHLDRCKKLSQNEKEILLKPNVMKEAHIVNYRFYTEDADPSYAYLVLDLCEKTLEDCVLSTENNEDVLKLADPEMIRQIFYGLKALHCGEPAILHRDLKPLNIFINTESEVVLADFGISRQLNEGQTSCISEQRGTDGWIAVESLPTEDDISLTHEQIKVRYKKQSDIQVAGMICFYILTKGMHPYGDNRIFRTINVMKGKPVNLKKLQDPVAKDLIEWMLQHNLKDRPSVQECLQHPYLLSIKDQFSLVTRVGNELEIKTKAATSVVVQELNEDRSLTKPTWKSKIDTDVMAYISTRRYTDDVADLLRLIRNTSEHWYDKPRPRAVQEKVGKPEEYFLKIFPTLPVVLHGIIRNQPDWKQRDKLKQFFPTSAN